MTVTLKSALGIAREHWEGRPGAGTMLTAAGACVAILGPATQASTLGTPDAVQLLATLRRSKGPKSVQVYYGAFRRALALAGVSTATWPKAPTPPRKTRDPLQGDDLGRLLLWLDAKGWQSTADLGRLMRGTGLRVRIEALTASHLTLSDGPRGADGEVRFEILHVVGKGAHERLLPVVREDTRALLRDGGRMEAIRRWSYRAHLERWNKGVKELHIKSRLATPHAVRHGYATEVLKKSGGNLALVQELLGHASPATTSQYVSVDIADKAGALTTGA